MTEAAFERLRFRRNLEQEGCRPDIPWLTQYEHIRENPYMRMTLAMEEMCEYILYLEDKIDEQIERKDMTTEDINNALKKSMIQEICETFHYEAPKEH